jgi:hypothetical protein
VVVPLIEHLPPNGFYFDDCAPHHHMRLSHVVAILVGLAMWVAIVVVAIVIFRALRG